MSNNGSNTEVDVSGVIEPPMVKVKDIRDKYKIRDYDDYAKPKSMTANKTNSNESKNRSSPKKSQSGVYSDDVDAPDHEVAQQVMSLFKGALDLQNDLEAQEQDKIAEKNFKESSSNKPLKQNGHVTSLSNGITEKTSSTNAPTTEPSVLQPTKNEESPSSPGKVEVDPEAVASFDESLDQFYDVFNNLTT